MDHYDRCGVVDIHCAWLYREAATKTHGRLQALSGRESGRYQNCGSTAFMPPESIPLKTETLSLMYTAEAAEQDVLRNENGRNVTKL